MSGDVAYTCETAGHFYLYQVLSRWEQYTSKVKPLSKKVSGYIIILLIIVSLQSCSLKEFKPSLNCFHSTSTSRMLPSHFSLAKISNMTGKLLRYIYRLYIINMKKMSHTVNFIHLFLPCFYCVRLC